MNIGLMRILDHYAGVPLCLLGTAIKKLFCLFSPCKNQGKRPENILLIELSELGSTILADPAMTKLKRQPGVKLFFVIFEQNRPGLELLGTVPGENIFSLRSTGLAALAADTLRFFFWTRRNGIDTVIDLELFSRFTALLTGFSGARRTVGFHAFHEEGLYRGGFLTHKVLYNPHQHVAKNFISLANAALADREETPYSKTMVPDEEMTLRERSVSGQAMQDILIKIRASYPAYDAERHKLVLFNTNSSELVPLRRWPRENFVRLAGMVLDSCPDVVIVLTGDLSERAEKDEIAQAVGRGRCVNFAGQTRVADLPALYAVSAFMLTNDSGPAHLASLTHMPVFVLFGPETPALYGPLGRMTPIYSGLACSPCVSATNHRKTVCNDNICLKLISPEQVLSVLRPRLEALAGHGWQPPGLSG